MTAGAFEREIKLRFDSGEAARASVLAAGAAPFRPRRLQSDALLDTDDTRLLNARSALRVRTEPGRCLVTFKGPPQPSVMKLREELETEVTDATVVLAVFDRLGFRVRFRYEKFREEFTLGETIVAIDETPIGTYVEVEGPGQAITSVAAMLGQSVDAYITESYRTLFLRHCAERGLEPRDMLFVR